MILPSCGLKSSDQCANLARMSRMQAIRVVLIEPLYSGNVGSICRAMANMDLDDLTLVAPRIVDGWAEGEKLAVHAGGLLQRRREVATLEEAVIVN